jgi:hypothetical protein
MVAVMPVEHPLLGSAGTAADPAHTRSGPVRGLGLGLGLGLDRQCPPFGHDRQPGFWTIDLAP